MPLFYEYILPLVFVALVVGSSVLWAKTRRVAVLLQLIASFLMCLPFAIERLSDYLSRAGKPALWKAIHEPPIEPIGLLVYIVGFVVFPIGYVSYALTHKRI